MVNASCPHCGAAAMDENGVCGQCGHGMRESSNEVLNTKAMLWVGLGFVFLLILWAAVLEPMMTRYNPFRGGN